MGTEVGRLAKFRPLGEETLSAGKSENVGTPGRFAPGRLRLDANRLPMLRGREDKLWAGRFSFPLMSLS